MIHLVGGKLVDVVEHPDGTIDAKTLREVTEAGPDRTLTVEHRDGSVDVVPADGSVRLGPDDSVISRLNAERGGQGALRHPDVIRRHVQRLAQGYALQVADDLAWVLIDEFRLPPGWEPRLARVLMYLPADYPTTPPGLCAATGVHLPTHLRYRGCRVRDFHEHGEHRGWTWFCYRHLGWNPQRDDLYSVLERLSLDLAHSAVLP